MKKLFLIYLLITIINCANLFSFTNLYDSFDKINIFQSQEKEESIQNFFYLSEINLLELNNKTINLFQINDNSDNKLIKEKITSNNIINEESDLFLSQSDFMYADNPLFTFYGDLPQKKTNIKPLNLGIISALYTTAFILQHNIQLNTIWKEKSDFKIQEDGKYAIYVDKAGHFYGCWVLSHFARETFLWSGFDYKSSYLLGAFTGLAYSTYIEILDGFGKNWGFSPSDFYFDVLGTAFSVAQYYIPFLQNFTPKFTYIPSNWFGERKRVPSEIIIDDYSSQVFWLSINIYNMLSENIKKYFPSFLQLSIGYTARNLCEPGYPEWDMYKYDYNTDYVKGDPKIILALDVDFVKLLPGNGKYWNWIKQSLNVLKFPSPAIEFSKSRTKFYLLYPFHF